MGSLFWKREVRPNLEDSKGRGWGLLLTLIYFNQGLVGGLNFSKKGKGLHKKEILEGFKIKHSLEIFGTGV